MEVSVFKVGFSGGLYYEGPECDEKGRVRDWHSPSAEWRYGRMRTEMGCFLTWYYNNVVHK